MALPAFLLPLLSEFGPTALAFVTKEGAEYLDALKNGKELTEEEKDKFYEILDVAKRMEDEERQREKEEEK